MSRKLGRRGFAALAGTLVVGGPVLAACSTGPTFDQWAATDGAAGRINLDEVQNAFKKSESASEFERRVNQLYEGDGLVLIRASQDGESLTLEGFEDLDKNGTIDEAKDDLLFTIVKVNDQHQMRGHGANGYYRSSFGAGDFLFTYLIVSSLTRYQTPIGNVSRMRNQRTNYRSSSAYRSQVSKNSRFFNTQKSFHGSNYDSAGRNLNPARQSYQSAQKTSGGFKNSGTGVRSSFGSRSGGSRGSSRGGRGGFGGFGGAQVVIGFERGQ